jgi:hypothetical protein
VLVDGKITQAKNLEIILISLLLHPKHQQVFLGCTILSKYLYNLSAFLHSTATPTG